MLTFVMGNETEHDKQDLQIINTIYHFIQTKMMQVRK